MINEHSQSCWADGHPTRIEHPDYDAFDRGNPLAAQIEGADAYTIAGEGLAALLSFCWCDGPDNMQSAFRKFVVITALLNGELLNDATYQELAVKLGCTKQALSKHASDLSNLLGGFKFRRSRPLAARQQMAQARGHDNRRKRGHGDAK